MHPRAICCDTFRKLHLLTNTRFCSALPNIGEIFRTCPDRPWGTPSPLYKEYRTFHGSKTARAWRWPSTPSSAEVKGRVQLHHVIGLPLTLSVYVKQQETSWRHDTLFITIFDVIKTSAGLRLTTCRNYVKTDVTSSCGTTPNELTPASTWNPIWPDYLKLWPKRHVSWTLLPQNCRRQKDDMTQFPYWGPKNIRRHRKKNLDDTQTWHPKFVNPWLRRGLNIMVSLTDGEVRTNM
jgi:hypothetical protein